MKNIALKLAILKSGKSQLTLAREAGISDCHLSKIINGWQIPNKETRQRLASILSENPTKLFQISPTDQPTVESSKIEDHK